MKKLGPAFNFELGPVLTPLTVERDALSLPPLTVERYSVPPPSPRSGAPLTVERYSVPPPSPRSLPEGFGGILFLAGESNGQFRDQPPKIPPKDPFWSKIAGKCNPRTSALLNFEPGPKRNKTETGFNLRGTTGFYKIKVAVEGKHTLNPPKHNPPKNKKQKKQIKAEKIKNKTTVPKKHFSVINQFLFFWVGVQNFPFLATWPKTRAPPKHYKK